ncbi:MAG: hypothetical protein OCC45_08250 [Desulfotalea sp.]
MNTPVWDNYSPTTVKADVLRYLMETGWNVKSSSFYDKKLNPNKDGFYTKLIVQNFIKKNQILFLGATSSEHTDDLATQKAEAEIKKLNAQASREQLKWKVEQGLYIERDLVTMELVSRAVVLDTGLEFFFKANIAEMIAMVGGDPSKAPLLLDFCLKQKDATINTYASMDDFMVSLEDDL